MTPDYKYMTVDECFEALVNLSIDDIGAGRVLIEAQRGQAVQEHKKQNPPIGWLPITDEQRDGQNWIIGGWRGGGLFDYDWGYFHEEYGYFVEAQFDGALPFYETHYLPIDQIPLPPKEGCTPEKELKQND